MLPNKIKIVLFTASAIFILTLYAGFSFGGEILGQVKTNSRVSNVEVQCENTRYRGSIDRYGSYSVIVRQQGRCQIKFQTRQGWTNTYSIRSYKDSNQIDFIIDGDGNLHRR
jgi:hypothetical protein